MKSIAKFLGMSSCYLAFGVTAVQAEPRMLSHAELDRVAAGSSCLAPCDIPFWQLPEFGWRLPEIGGGFEFPAVIPIEPNWSDGFSPLTPLPSLLGPLSTEEQFQLSAR